MINNILTKYETIENTIKCSKQEFEILLPKLLESDEIKYSDFKNSPSNFITDLKPFAGIYHFFTKNQEEKKSLYIGKADFGSTDTWNLYERLKQHFQPSQEGLPDKIRIALNKEEDNLVRENIIIYLSNEEVYFQILQLFKLENGKKVNQIDEIPNLVYSKKQIVLFEKLFISMLKPVFTDE